MSRTVETTARVWLEQSSDAFHAHVELPEGLLVRPGDRVEVHGAPIRITFGERVDCQRPATLHRASLLRQWWTRLAAWFELTELTEIGFSAGR